MKIKYGYTRIELKIKISIIEKIEVRIVYDLADRVAKIYDINITNR